MIKHTCTFTVYARVLVTLLLVPAQAAEGPKQPIPDLTKGEELTRINERWAATLGVYCGAWRARQSAKHEVNHIKQLLVRKIEKGSPADGVLKVGDVILGADGTGAKEVPLFQGGQWPMIPLADAIADAEASNPALLKLRIFRPSLKRKVKTGNLTIKLDFLGRYSDTAPYNCPKSKRILQKGIDALLKEEKGDEAGFSVLCLLAAAHPDNPRHDAIMAKAKEWAYALEPEGSPWYVGPKLMALAEYYMKTKDKQILPKLKALAEFHALGVSWFGTCGHRYSEVAPDGSANGRIGGYGPITCSGTLGFLGLSLSREAGVTSEAIEKSYQAMRAFYGHYAGKSAMNYGEMPYSISGARGDNNGKCAMSAIALSMEQGYEKEAKFYASLATISGYKVRQYAHGGSFFGQVFHPLGAIVAGEKAANMQFREVRWHMDLKRRWDYRYLYDGKGNGYKNYDHAAAALLFYAAPLKQLIITGRDRNPALELTDKEFQELDKLRNYDATKVSTDQLFADLPTIQGNLRGPVGKELARRAKENPGSAESNTIVDRLLKMAVDPDAGIYNQVGSCFSLMMFKNRNKDTTRDEEIVKAMVSLLGSETAYIRFAAVRVMQQINPQTVRPHADAIMDAIIATDRPTFPLDRQDPMQWAHGEMGALLASALKKGLDGIDRAKLMTALRSSLNTPNGSGRRRASSILDKLTKEEIQKLADVVVENVKIAPPANSMGGSGMPQSMQVLSKYLFEEGLLLSFAKGETKIALKNKIHQEYGQAAFEMQSTPLLMEDFGDLMLASASLDANKVIEEMKQAPAPDRMAKLKRIDAVKATNSTITLPFVKTKLMVDATNYGRSEKETTYTWRKVYGAGKVDFSPNDSSGSKTTTVSFTDQKPGKYRFEVSMSDTLGYNVIRKTVDVVLYDKSGGLPANKPPKATSQSLKAVPGLPLDISLAGTDPDGDDLGYKITKQPSNGRITGIGGGLTYTAKFGFNDTDTFTFEAIDGQGKTATGTVKLKVSDKDVGVAVYEGFDYPTGPLHNKEGGFGFSGPWINSKASDKRSGYTVSAEPDGKSAGKSASLSYASIPSKGGRFVKGRSHATCSRKLDRDLLKKHKMLEPGGEMWFSFFFSEVKNRSVTFSAGESTSFGADISSKSWGVYAIIDGKFNSDSDRNAWSRTAKYRFPKEPNMVVGRCVWGKTDEEPDIVEVYRVFNAPGYDLVIPDKPVSVTVGLIPQEMIKAIVIEQKFESPLDEIRVGPTRHSVMLGTKPLR